MNKRLKNNGILIILFIFTLALNMASCEDYLDKAPESDISDKDVFGNFRSFQGFVEEMYHAIGDPHKMLAGNRSYCAFFDDAMYSQNPLMWDDGNYWFEQHMFMHFDPNRGNLATTGNTTMQKKIWPLAWLAIRKANVTLANLDMLENATQEQRDALAGQAYYFRGFFHLELMQYYGGLPYIDTLLVADDELRIPRLNYRESAMKAAKDFKKAAELLPLDWDLSSAGELTKGANDLRATKIEALAYLGRNYLYAASPMMNESSGGPNAYDVELCQEAAKAFAEVIELSASTGKHELETWENRTKNFWVVGVNARPRSKELIRNQMIYQAYTRHTLGRTGLPGNLHNGGKPWIEAPTHNYIENYGMANGLPLDDPESGYDTSDPFKGRDPRFYIDIVADGMMLRQNAPESHAEKYAHLYNGGLHKGTENGKSVTGYLYRKFNPIGFTGKGAGEGAWKDFEAAQPRMRLADVYLMYAEAVLWGYGDAKKSAPGTSLTAEGAFNKVRFRSTGQNIPARYLVNQQTFMEEIIRERAVELAFEGFRWFDIRRWNLLADMKYREKYALDFDRGPGGKPINIQRRLLYTRPIEKKHNWVPFRTGDISIYKEFPQNPGW